MAEKLGAFLKSPRNIHDSYFRAVLQSPERAADFLRCHLPPAIVRLLADEQPELQDGSFVDDNLRNRHSDRLFRVKLRSGEYIFVIVEHASKVDPEMANRLLHYRIRIWDREKDTSDAKPGRLTPILALVVYTGKARWTAPLSLPGMMTGTMTGNAAFHDMMREDLALRDQMCGSGYWLRDIGRMPEDQLGSNPDLKGAFLVLKHAYGGPVGKRVLHRIRELISEGTDFERQTYRYILDAFDTDSDTLSATLKTKGATTVGVLVESVIGRVRSEGRAEGRSEGRAEGRSEGRAEGRSEGRASILNRLLERRFGRLPPGVRERVRCASVQELDAWADTVLDAPTLEAVFVDPPRH